MIPVPAMILVAQIAMPVADRVPQFNLEPTCKGAATASTAIRSDKDVCLQKEQQARDDLSQQWANFAAADKRPLRPVGQRRRHRELCAIAHVSGNGEARARIAQG